ncbi:MAG: DMT family transporter, partial [Marmoricola sp.]|nr:DMT family transporter [Marmoricola sp.]
IGVTVVVWGDLSLSGGSHWAYALPVVGMLSLAGGTVLTRRLRPPEGLLDTIMMQAVVTAVVLDVVAAAAGQLAPLPTWQFWAAVLWLIVLASLGGYVMYVHVTRTQGATVVSTLLYLTPPTTMLWVYLMFGVPVHLAGFVGLAISALGVVLVLHNRRRSSAQVVATATTPALDRDVRRT